MFGYTLGSLSDTGASNSIDDFGAIMISPFREEADAEKMQHAGSFNNSTKILEVNPAASAMSELPDNVVNEIINNATGANPSANAKKFTLF